MTKQELVKDHTLEFINNLVSLKKIYTQEYILKETLKTLHRSYCKLRNVIRNHRLIDSRIIQQTVCDDIIEYKMCSISIVYHTTLGYLSVQTGSCELNEYLFSRRGYRDLVWESILFIGYEDIVCDLCGLIGYEIPKNKVIDRGCILSFHDECFKMYFSLEN